MLFSFSNSKAIAEKLTNAQINFQAGKPLNDAIHYLENRAVSIFAQSYQNVQSVAEITTGALHIGTWKNIGVTFAAVCPPNPPQGEEWPLNFKIPHALYIDVTFWIAPPFE